MIKGQILTGFAQAQSKLNEEQILTPINHILGNPTLAGRIETFCNYGAAADYSTETLKAYRGHLGEFVKYMRQLGITTPEQVLEEHIIAFIIHKRNTCNGTSIYTYFIHVRAWFNWMLARGIISQSPFAMLKKPILPKTIIKPITPEQVDMLLACCTNLSYGIRDRAIIMLIFDSGLRRSEVCKIKLEDINFKKRSIHVMGKGSKERLVAIGERTKEAILNYLFIRKDTLPWLFISRYMLNPAPLTPDAVTHMVSKMFKRAGITGVKRGPHTLRHSFATTSILNGANLFELQALLGHSELDMTKKYARTIDCLKAVEHHHAFSPADRLKR